jgi:hypothetical protein
MIRGVGVTPASGFMAVTTHIHFGFSILDFWLLPFGF